MCQKKGEMKNGTCNFKKPNKIFEHKGNFIRKMMKELGKEGHIEHQNLGGFIHE